MAWSRPAKIAFVGSHGIRKTTAAMGFAATMQRARHSVEMGREVVRDNPLGINEGASPRAQLWVLMSQIRQELELAPKAEVLVTDRGVMDNFCYYLRVCGGQDLFGVLPLITEWSKTYDLVVRLTPDVKLRPDGTRSTNDAFRDAIEELLDLWLPKLLEPSQLITFPASAINKHHDWWETAQRLATIVGEPLMEQETQDET